MRFIVKKSVISIIMAFLTALIPLSVTAETDRTETRIFINDEEYSFKISPILEDGTAYVPLRYTMLSFGATVSWNERNNTVLIVKDGNNTVLDLNTMSAVFNGEELSPDSFKIENGSVMVSLPFLERTLGAKTKSDAEKKIINIYQKGYVNADDVENLPYVEPTMTDADLLDASVTGGQYGTMEKVDVEGMPFDKALRITTTKRPTNSYDFQLDIPTPNYLNAGDVVLVKFYIRALSSQSETGMGEFRWVYELNSNPYTKVSSVKFAAGKEWEQLYWSFESNMDCEGSKTHITMPVGFNPQVLEVGGFEFINFEKEVTIDQLPKISVGYNGRKADAQWRDEALERIEQIRKADLNVTVNDENGQPAKGAVVDITMTRNAFQFGTAVNFYNCDDSDKGRRYKNAIKSYFNTVVTESAMKWKIDDYNYLNTAIAKKWINWCLDNNIEVRGHNLVWDDVNRFMPPDVAEILESGTHEELRKRIEDHITYSVSNYKGALCEWDVLNEPTEKHTIISKYGLEEVKLWFEAAKAIDPDAKRFVNEYVLGGSTNNPLRYNFLEILKKMVDMGVPFDGVGVQSHQSGTKDPMELYEQYNDIANLGKRVKITEFGCYISDEELQRDFVRDFLIMCYSHPAIDGFLMWGFWDGNHFQKNAPIFREDWSIKPSGEQYINLVTREWQTDVQRIADENGAVSVRGFKGNYDIKVTYNGETKVFKRALNEDSSIVLNLSDADESGNGDLTMAKYSKPDIGNVVTADTDEVPKVDKSDELLEKYIKDGDVLMHSDFTHHAYGKTGETLQGVNTADWKKGNKPTAQYLIDEEDGNRFASITTTGKTATDPYMYCTFGNIKGSSVVISSKIRLSDEPGTVLNFDLSNAATRVQRLATVSANEGGRGKVVLGISDSGFAGEFNYTPGTWITVTIVITGLNEDKGEISFYVNGELMTGKWPFAPKTLESVRSIRFYTTNREGAALKADVDDIWVVKPFSINQ